MSLSPINDVLTSPGIDMKLGSPGARPLLLGSLLLVSSNVAAQRPELADPTLVKGIHSVPFGGVRYGAPLGFSAYGGFAIGRSRRESHTGISVTGEAGQAGARAGIGLSSTAFASTMRGAVTGTRIWKSRGSVESGDTYVGVEGLITVMLIGVSLGHHWRMDSSSPGAARLLAVGLVVGL